jgi:hypothetical protein
MSTGQKKSKHCFARGVARRLAKRTSQPWAVVLTKLTVERRQLRVGQSSFPPAVPELYLLRPMKNTLRLTSVAMILSTIMLSVGCQKKTAGITSGSDSKPESSGSTKPLQAAGLVGYDGTRLRKSVDHIKEANEKHNQEVEKMAGSGPDQ